MPFLVVVVSSLVFDSLVFYMNKAIVIISIFTISFLKGDVLNFITNRCFLKLRDNEVVSLVIPFSQVYWQVYFNGVTSVKLGMNPELPTDSIWPVSVNAPVDSSIL